MVPSWQFRIVKMIFWFQRLLNPPTGALDVEKERVEIEALAARFKTKIKLTRTPVDANDVPAEWIDTPAASSERIILYLHGGSYNSASIKSHHSLAANIANSAQARALIIDYRLAPENPFPAAVDDAVAAYQWLLSNNIASNRIIVAGDSCGGGLALSLLISLREINEPLPAAVVCLSPWTDLTCTGDSWVTNAKNDIFLDPDFEKKSAKLYLGDADPQTPLASPLYADLRALPPLLIQVGSDELLLSDATRLAERAKAAGVDVTLEVWKDMQHEWHFAASVLPEGKRAIDRVGEFIMNHCG
ncbi:MAG: alpha/beta hydrolase [Chloroflexi bacterium]|nr:alpha/beta hydrolase [Chloroflexota bacterium]